MDTKYLNIEPGKAGFILKPSKKGGQIDMAELWYIENENNLLSRCGYVILGKAALFLDKVNGDYNTLFGISPSKLYEQLKKLGYKLSDFELK